MKTIRYSLIAAVAAVLATAPAGWARGGGGGGSGGHGNGYGGGRNARTGTSGPTSSRSRYAAEARKGGLGILSVRVDEMLKQSRKNGLSAEQTEALLQPVKAAHEEGLPPEPVFSKIEEGLAKKADPEAIERVAASRLEHLRTAGKLLEEQSLPLHSGTEKERLVAQICLTLESGLSPENIRPVLKTPEGASRSGIGRLSRVLAAGETLRLGGFSPEETQQIMEDCRALNLNGIEIQRAVNYLLHEHRKGVDFETLHARLWRHTPGKSGSSDCRHGKSSCTDGSGACAAGSRPEK